MFTKKIESTFDDPLAGHAEFEKHRAAATEVLGANPMIASSATSSVPVMDDAGNHTGEHRYKLITVWKSRPPTGEK